MEIITKAKFEETISCVLREEFEVIGLHSFYLEVLSNEKQFVSKLIQWPVEADVHNASELFAHNEGKYEFIRLVEKGIATKTYYLYDDLNEAHKHALMLLRGEKLRFDVA